MLRLRPRQRGTLIDKLSDVANVAVGALVFGPFLGGQPFSEALALIGVGLWLVLMAVVLFLGRKDGA